LSCVALDCDVAAARAVSRLAIRFSSVLV